MSWLLSLATFLASFFKKPVPPVPPLPPEPTPPAPPPVDPDAPRKHLLECALKAVGHDASPSDLAPDEYGCAETVSDILNTAFADFPGSILLTADLYKKLLAHLKFEKVTIGEPGDVIISPTGYGNGLIPNGHTGIFDSSGKIMSNDSRNGIFQPNYTLDSWVARFRKTGGYPIYIFRRVEL